MRLTARSLLDGAAYHRLGDLWILPGLAADNELLVRQTESLAELPENGLFGPPRAAKPFVLANRYQEERRGSGAEPAWAERCPPELLAHLRRSWCMGEGTDPLAIIPELPFTGIGYVVEERGFSERVIRAFGVQRLAGIRQLGFLHNPVIGNGEEGAATLPFTHNRYCHSLDAMAVATLIARNNSLPRRTRRHARAAALVHDALTPAGGDTTKIVDRAAFDEDAHFPELLRGDAWEEIRHRYRLSGKRLARAVMGEGVAGRILDLADKIAYLARDASIFLRSNPAWGPPCAAEEHAAVKRILRGNPLACGIWDAVEIADGDVFVADPDRLRDFLLLRTYLFRGLYYHPAARFWECLVGNIALRYLYDTGRLTREALLAMTDAELERRVEEVMGPLLPAFISSSDGARVEAFESREEAVRREAELLAEGTALALIEEAAAFTSPGTKIRVRDGDAIRPFSEARPEESRDIAEILRPAGRYRLYYHLLDGRSLAHPPLQAALAHSRGLQLTA